MSDIYGMHKASMSGDARKELATYIEAKMRKETTQWKRKMARQDREFDKNLKRPMREGMERFRSKYNDEYISTKEQVG